MKTVLFLQHGQFDLPGLLREVLVERGILMQTLHPWNGDALPESLGDFTGFVIGGGGQSAYEEEEYPYLIREKKLIREARERGLPTLGICLGAQLIASALGAEVKPNLKKEIGFFPVTLSEAAAGDPLFEPLPHTLLPTHWHGDTFDLPRGAVHLASSTLTKNQAFAVDERLYGVQFHPEMTLPMLTEMVHADSAWLESAGVAPANFLAAAKEHLPAFASIARGFFHRWTDLIAPILVHT